MSIRYFLKSIVRTVINIALLPITVFLSFILYPNILFAYFSSYKPYFKEVMGLKEKSPEKAVRFHIPGNADNQHRNAIYAPGVFFFSLNKAARDLKNKLIQLEDNPHVNAITIDAISMGGATTILALDLLVKENIQLKKLVQCRIASTFSSLSAVIFNVLDTNAVGFYFLIGTILTIVLSSVACFVPVPGASHLLWLIFAFGGQFVFVNFCQAFDQVEDDGYTVRGHRNFRSMAHSLATALLSAALVLTGLPLPICFMPAVVYILTDSYLSPIYFLLWSLECHADVRKAMDNVKSSQYKNVVETYQNYQDPLLGTGVLFTEKYPADLSVDWSLMDHMNVPTAWNIDGFFPR